MPCTCLSVPLQKVRLETHIHMQPTAKSILGCWRCSATPHQPVERNVPQARDLSKLEKFIWDRFAYEYSGFAVKKRQNCAE